MLQADQDLQVAGSKDVEESFPEPLKGPILRKVQFQTISRVDNLGKKLCRSPSYSIDVLTYFMIVDVVYDVGSIPVISKVCSKFINNLYYLLVFQR